MGLYERVVQLLQVAEEEKSSLEQPPPGLLPTQSMSPVLEKSGDVIGPYKLLQQIGQGGFGVVYMAEQRQPV